MAIGQGGRHESFKWGRAALTATNDEIVTLVTLGWDIGRVVESGDADAVLDAPQHDYTRRLLAATPVPDPSRQQAEGSAA